MQEFEKEWKMLKPSLLVVDRTYQRDLDEPRVRKTVREFDINTVNPPKVSFRDGKYWIFDGQHTVAIWRQVFGDKPIECRVFYGMTWLDEKEAFVKQNGISKDPTTNDKMRAAYNAQDPDVLDMVRAANFSNVQVNFENSGGVPGKCIATAALFHMYKTLSRDDYISALSVLTTAWPLDVRALSANILRGMTVFYHTYTGKFKQSDLIASLQYTSPVLLFQEARGMPGSKGNVFARLILRCYNRRRTAKKLEDII